MESRREFIYKTGLLSMAALWPLNKNNVEMQNIHQNVLPIKAKRLNPGDTIAISSPAGAVWDVLQVEKFVSILKSFGFNLILGKTLSLKNGYLAGTDEERAAELNMFFSNKEVKGIFCMKGGWGCARILDKLDYEQIKQNPKIIIGFSDVTSLLNAIYTKTRLITFHGPVGNSGWNDFTSGVFKNIICKGEKNIFPKTNFEEDKIVTIMSGISEGELIGGNLSVTTSLIGTSYLPSANGKILFLEETKEEPYCIDRMLTQMQQAGFFSGLKGIVIGKFVKCEAEEPQKAFTFMEVLDQHFKPLGIPVYYGAMTGHIENKWTLPIGAKVKMNADEGTLILQEPAVT